MVSQAAKVAKMIEERERLSYYTTRRKTMGYVCRVFPVSTGELYSPTDLNAAHEYVKPQRECQVPVEKKNPLSKENEYDDHRRKHPSATDAELREHGT